MFWQLILGVPNLNVRNLSIAHYKQGIGFLYILQAPLLKIKAVYY